MYLTEKQDTQIKTLGRDLEVRTGVEFMAAVVGKCDNYPEIPWKAFGMFTAIGALAAAGYHMLNFTWAAWTPVLTLCSVLAAGAAGALLTPFWPALAHLFLDTQRAETESRQFAQSLFLEHALFETRQRKAILLLIALFERQVILLPDSGVRSRLKPGQLEGIIGLMGLHLRQGDHFQALVQGIGRIEQMLLEAGFEGSPDAPDQIQDELIQQKGAVS